MILIQWAHYFKNYQFIAVFTIFVVHGTKVHSASTQIIPFSFSLVSIRNRSNDERNRNPTYLFHFPSVIINKQDLRLYSNRPKRITFSTYNHISLNGFNPKIRIPWFNISLALVNSSNRCDARCGSDPLTLSLVCALFIWSLKVKLSIEKFLPQRARRYFTLY